MDVAIVFSSLLCLISEWSNFSNSNFSNKNKCRAGLILSMWNWLDDWMTVVCYWLIRLYHCHSSREEMTLHEGREVILIKDCEDTWCVGINLLNYMLQYFIKNKNSQFRLQFWLSGCLCAQRECIGIFTFLSSFFNEHQWWQFTGLWYN